MSLTETRRAASFVLSEADGHLSRDNVVIAYGAGDLDPGTVLKKADISLTPNVTTVNASSAATLSSAASLVTGRRYKITSANIPAGATFVASGTTAIVLQNAAGTANVNATSSAGPTASTITENVSGQMEKWATGGTATGINIYPAKAAAAEVGVSAITRVAEVIKTQLTYPGSTDAEVAASLKLLNIIVRA